MHDIYSSVQTRIGNDGKTDDDDDDDDGLKDLMT